MSSLGVAPVLLLWALIGAALAVMHLWMLRRALDRAALAVPARAGARVAIGMPLRLLAVAPILMFAARAGLWACLGLVAGNLVGRWLGLVCLRGRSPLPIRCYRQG